MPTGRVRPLLAFQSTTFGYTSDLSGSLQGAGGIAGLLARIDAAGLDPAATYYYTYDGNGNASELLRAADGAQMAHYEYDPFGKLVYADGVLAQDNRFWFSTKYHDDETGLVYYGYRYYSPELGRWLTRDPIEEEGGINVYSFVSNNPLNMFDPLGLRPPSGVVTGTPTVKDIVPTYQCYDYEHLAVWRVTHVYSRMKPGIVTARMLNSLKWAKRLTSIFKKHPRPRKLGVSTPVSGGFLDIGDWNYDDVVRELKYVDQCDYQGSSSFAYSRRDSFLIFDYYYDVIEYSIDSDPTCCRGP